MHTAIKTLLAIIPATIALSACDNTGNPNQPPERVSVDAPQWVERFDARASKRRCSVTDTQTGETQRTYRNRASVVINSDFSLNARRRTCIITENATGISCRFRGYAGRVTSCTAPNPRVYNAPANITVSAALAPIAR